MLNIAFCQHVLNSNFHLQELLKTNFNGAHISERHLELALLSDCQAFDHSYLYVLKQWRDLLAVILLLKNQNLLKDNNRLIILKRFRFLRSVSIWPECQLMTLYPSLVSSLMGLAKIPFNQSQSSSGFCPSLFFESSPFGELPHPLYHAELGCLLCLHGEVSETPLYIEAAIKMGLWQKNTFDFNLNPFISLFSKEGETSRCNWLLLNFSLFRALEKFSDDLSFKAIADRLYQKIEQLNEADGSSTFPLALILAQNYQEKLDVNENPLNMEPVILDKSLALVGIRSSRYSAFSTLYGHNSGMGSLTIGDVSLINYAPQYIPLGEFQGFGLQGGERLLGPYVKKIIASEMCYQLEGLIRMKAFQVNEHRATENPETTWIDTNQLFEDGVLNISLAVKDPLKNEGLAFVFFVTCQTCDIESGKSIKAKSFDRYQGSSTILLLKGENSVITIESKLKDLEMHVIPLGGGENFWGADFLVAYYLKTSEKEFSWRIY